MRQRFQAYPRLAYQVSIRESMAGTYYFVIPIIGVLLVAVFILAFTRAKARKESTKKKAWNFGNRSVMLKEASKRLSQNPKDAEALKVLADLHFQEETYDKAYKAYETLIELCATNKEVDEFETTVKYAISAIRVGKYAEAHKSLVIARTMNPEPFEVNYNLGFLEYKRKNYEKATTLLTQAKAAQPDHALTLKYLGLCQCKLKKFDTGETILRKALDIQPDDKEALFALGQCCYELDKRDQALRIFTHLRGDPTLGVNACLFAGTLNTQTRRYSEAASDFEIGLRHDEISDEARLEMKYRLAVVHIHLQNFGEALKLFEQIQAVAPGYKDVVAQIGKYKELNLNNHLKIYLLGSTSEFINLCRRLTVGFFPRGTVKVVDIAVQKNEYADILVDVHEPRIDEVVLFRFVRSSADIGDLPLREMYARIKELKANRGLCINAAGFSETAQEFVEARLIDLIDKAALVKRLNRLSA